MSELTAERLRELLHFEAETGVFRWKVRRGPVAKGDVAGTLNASGYVRIRVEGVKQQAHRLAWLYVYGVWPADQLDHIDGIRSSNRIANLREATNAENHQNRKLQRNNTSGYMGVRWHKASKSWSSELTVGYRRRHLGLFPTPEEAHAAYLAAKANLHTFNPVPRKTTTKASNDQNYQAAARG